MTAVALPATRDGETPRSAARSHETPKSESEARDNQFAVPQYTLLAADKQPMLLRSLNALTAHHRAASPTYARMIDALGRYAEALRPLRA